MARKDYASVEEELRALTIKFVKGMPASIADSWLDTLKEEQRYTTGLSDELLVANLVFLAWCEEGRPWVHPSYKQWMVAWLEERQAMLGLDTQTIARIATVANPDKRGGNPLLKLFETLRP